MYKALVTAAFAAAATATQEFLAKHGDADCCGFAWVKFPGNTKFGRYMKKEGHARSSYGGGLQVWNPAKSGTQSLSAIEAGADAFAAVLKGAGIEGVYSQSRMD
jgi:hypothetical protein